jgi:hypothetical protein
VGFVFSHNKREFLFSAEEVMKVVSLQAEALSRNPERGKAFCTLKLTVTDEGQSQLESFQVSSADWSYLALSSTYTELLLCFLLLLLLYYRHVLQRSHWMRYRIKP